eukprot:gene6346-4572_t
MFIWSTTPILVAFFSKVFFRKSSNPSHLYNTNEIHMLARMLRILALGGAAIHAFHFFSFGFIFCMFLSFFFPPPLVVHFMFLFTQEALLVQRERASGFQLAAVRTAQNIKERKGGKKKRDEKIAFGETMNIGYGTICKAIYYVYHCMRSSHSRCWCAGVRSYPHPLSHANASRLSNRSRSL